VVKVSSGVFQASPASVNGITATNSSVSSSHPSEGMHVGPLSSPTRRSSDLPDDVPIYIRYPSAPSADAHVIPAFSPTSVAPSAGLGMIARFGCAHRDMAEKLFS